jgi:ATP-dependent RNA helicase RhlE
VAKLAEGLLRDPVRIEVVPQGQTLDRVDQSVELLSTGDKRSRLAAILSTPEASRVIVFARTKRGADRVAQNLGKDGIEAEAIHGNKAQNARQRALDAFRSGRVRVLVATDIAARGIDVTGISHVINYDLPDEAESYVHRIGRTARNGADGVAITLCAPEERDKLRAVEKLTRTRLDGSAFTDTGTDRAVRRRPGGPAGSLSGMAPRDDASKPKHRRRRFNKGRAAA